MKKNGFALSLVFILFIFCAHKTYCQVVWEKQIDTFEINEGEVVDSTIITILDSAFTFLRLPILDPDLPYYYSLYIVKDEMYLKSGISNISLYVQNTLVLNHDVDWFNAQDKLLLNYKDQKIIVYLYSVSVDDIAYKYIKPNGKKSDFYFTYKRSSSKPYTFFEPDKLYEESASFMSKKEYLGFTGYKLNITNSRDLRIH